MLTVQVAPTVLVQPVKLTKVEPASAVAVRVTEVPLSNACVCEVQAVPQEIPAGLDVTLPVPLPLFVNARLYWRLKVTVTLAAAVMLTVQLVPLVLVHPLKLTNREPASAIALSVTDVPLSNGCVCEMQAAPQEIPAGVDVTLPVPVPLFVSARLYWRLKVAVTLRAADIATVQVAPLVESQPLKLTNRDPGSGAAVNVTDTPVLNACVAVVQAEPQLIPAGLEVTDPVPVPPFVSIRL
jgi:hypothetical protein